MYKKYTIISIFAACSIMYQMLVSNLLAYISGDQVLFQTITIGFLIFGMGIGSLLSDKISIEKSEKVLFWGEFCLIALMPLFIGFILLISLGYNYYEFFLTLSRKHIFLIDKLKLIYISLSQILIIITGIITGLELPLMIKGYATNENKSLFFNYFGILLGSLTFSFILYPVFNFVSLVFIITLLNAVAIYVLSIRKMYKFIILGIVALNYYINIPQLMLLEDFFYKGIYSFASMNIKDDLTTKLKYIKNRNSIETYKSPYQRIDIVVEPNRELFGKNLSMSGEEILFPYKDMPYTFTLYIDKKFQFSNTNEIFYHQGFAHIPIELHKKPIKNVLVLGAGDGLLVRELLKYEDIQQITIIELDAMIIDLSKKHSILSKLNENSLNNPKVNLINGDAFAWIKNNKDKKFDAIFVDFPYPNNHDVAKLYSVEFYKKVNKVLNEDGFMVIDAPIIPTNFKNNSIMLSTLYYAGFQSNYPYIMDEEPFIISYKNKQVIDFNQLSSNNPLIHGMVKYQYSKLKNTQYNHEISTKHINSLFRILF